MPAGEIKVPLSKDFYQSSCRFDRFLWYWHTNELWQNEINLKIGCLTIDFSQTSGGQEGREDSDTAYLGAFPDVMRVQLLPS